MNNNKFLVNLRLISRQDYRFLYQLLKERKPEVNISHKKMPTYLEHVKFVKSNPYSRWYVIEYNGNKVGSAYLSKQNEIGIFIKKKWQRSHIGSFALDLLIKKNPRPRYLANINPKNTKSIRFFKRNGFKLIQHTYELNYSVK